jgi:regulatory protein SWI4
MASTGLIEILLKNGADPLVPNSSGLNCISRSIFFNNSYQEQNFHVLVDLMKNCLYTPDKQGRVPLHYLAASNSSKAQIAKYYTETILERLVKENGNLVKVVLNHKDINNETAFELAQKSNNKMVLEVLTQFGGGGHKVDEIHRNQQYDQSFNESVSMGDSPIESPTIPNVPTLPLKEVGPILTSMLSSLADAYDTELKNKEEESKHTESILENLKTDIRETGSQNDVILSQLENGNATYDELKVTITELEDSCSKKYIN